jgi:hypothetical protein
MRGYKSADYNIFALAAAGRENLDLTASGGRENLNHAAAEARKSDLGVLTLPGQNVKFSLRAARGTGEMRSKYGGDIT